MTVRIKVGNIPYIRSHRIGTLIFADKINDFDWLLDEGEFEKYIDMRATHVA